MSKDLSFREKLARRGDTSAEDQAASYSHVDVRIERPEIFAHPVALAKLLRDNGLRLAEAHDAVTRIANNHVVTVRLRSADMDGVLSQLEAFGLSASAPSRSHAAAH